MYVTIYKNRCKNAHTFIIHQQTNTCSATMQIRFEITRLVFSLKCAISVILYFLSKRKWGIQFWRLQRDGRRFDHEPMIPSYCIRNTGNSQNLFRSTPILFRATHVEFRTSQSEGRNKMFYVLLKLKTNSVDYHDGVHLAMCKLWNIAERFV